MLEGARQTDADGPPDPFGVDALQSKAQLALVGNIFLTLGRRWKRWRRGWWQQRWRRRG